MPVDNRRITGPDSSQSPYLFVKKVTKYDNKLINENGLRFDGREWNQMRPVFLHNGNISRARGSAYLEQNNTKVICAVYGPREIARREDFTLKGHMTCEFKFATFSCKFRREHQQDAEEKDYSLQILEALEPAVCLHKFPKAQVDVLVTVLENDGSVLSAAISCASIALADAGIEMYDLVVGCSARIYGEKILLDPCLSEEYSTESQGPSSNGNIAVGLMPSLNQISVLTTKGEISFQQINQAIQLCVEYCQKLSPVLQHSLAKSVKKKLLDTKT